MGLIDSFKNVLSNMAYKQHTGGDRQGYTYRGNTLFQGDSANKSTGLYYNLWRENTDLRRCIEELYQTVGKDGYVLLQNGNPVQPENIINALEYNGGLNNLISIIIRDLQLSGNDFLSDIVNASGQILGFQNLDPRTMQIIADSHGDVMGYRQVVNQNIATFTPDEITHSIDSIDPDNEVWGISKIETLVLDILSDKEATKSNYSFFKNNAIPSTIITLDNDLGENEIKIALEQLKSQFGGGENNHKVSASNGIKDVKVIGSSIKDMEFAALRGLTTEKVTTSMGVPKTILGYSDGVNYSTSDNQYRKYIENTIRPLQTKVQEILNRLIARIDPSVKLEFIDNFAFDLDSKIERSIKLFEHGALTVNELREISGEEPYENEMAETPLIRQGFEILEDVGVNEITEPITDNTNNNASE